MKPVAFVPYNSSQESHYINQMITSAKLVIQASLEKTVVPLRLCPELISPSYCVPGAPLYPVLAFGLSSAIMDSSALACACASFRSL